MSLLVSTMSSVEVGNTKTSTRIATSIYWTFTLNNFTKEEFNILEKEICTYCLDYRVQEEIGESGTPHLQGYIQAKKRIRPTETFSNKRIHWEKCRSPKHAREYCCKEDSATGNYILDTIEPIDLIKPDRPWQLDVMNIIKGKPTRQIHWFWEPIGGSGKTTICRWLVAKHDALYLSGNAKDCKYAVVQYREVKKRYPKIILWNIPRTAKEHISYDAVESIEDGLFFSGKYECASILMNFPHVIIFANFAPNGWELSIRKWNIIEIKTQQVVEEPRIEHNMLTELHC